MFKKFFVKADEKPGTISRYNPKTGETKIVREISKSIAIPPKQHITLSPEKIQKAQNDADWILHTMKKNVTYTAFVEVQHNGQSDEQIKNLLQERFLNKISKMKNQVKIVAVSKPEIVKNPFNGFISTRQEIHYQDK